MSKSMKPIWVGLIITGLLLIPIISDIHAFKLKDYEMKIEVQFLNNNQVAVDNLVEAIDNGLMEQIIFENMEPIAVGQWDIDDIIADNSISTSNALTFHDDVVLLDSSTVDMYTNTKIVIDPVITEINTAQGANKATVQDQIVQDTQLALRDQLIGFGINEFLWDLHYDQGVIRFADKVP